MIATIANCAIVPPKLMFGVFRNGGGNSGSRANNPKPMTPKPHFCTRDRRSHHWRSPSPGAINLSDQVDARSAFGFSFGAHALAFPRLSPSIPVGRISSTRTRSTNATTSRHWVPNTACP